MNLRVQTVFRPWDIWDGDSLDEPIQKCFQSCIFYYHDRRNAWNDSISQRYPLHQAFHPSLYKAKASIEERRVQGSQWRILELPALVVEGHSLALVAVEINTERPFLQYTERAPCKMTLEGAAEALEPQTRNRLMRFIAPIETMTKYKGQYSSFKSKSIGPKNRYPLIWPVESSKISPAFLELLIQRWTKHIQKAINNGDTAESMKVSPDLKIP